MHIRFVYSSLSLLLSACSGAEPIYECSTIGLPAVVVEIDGSSPVYSVMASHFGADYRCSPNLLRDDEDAGAGLFYTCLGRQPPAGQYTVRVKSDDQVWSQSVDVVVADKCHVLHPGFLRFDLDSNPD